MGHHRRLVAEHGVPYYAQWFALRMRLWGGARAGMRAYTALAHSALAARRRSDTVFVFGSGYSLNDLSPADWQHFARHDVFGFSGFVYQRWIPTGFHLVRGWDEGTAGLQRWRTSAAQYARRLRENPYFASTAFILQGDYSAIFANTLLTYRLLPRGAAVCRYRTARRLDDRLSERWSAGVTHGPGTLADTINVAYLLGWRRIVLVGVDMYDSRYFWGPPDATLDFDEGGEFAAVTVANDHGIAWNTKHHSARNGMVDVLGRWGALFALAGVSLMVFNPRSLLAGVLPVYERAREDRDR
jgi:hypothetical protein